VTRIKKSEVQNVSLSAGFGFADNVAVRTWMQSKGFDNYESYARAYVRTPRDQIRHEIEEFATS